MNDINPETGRPYAVSDQDLKNGLSSVLQYVAHAFAVPPGEAERYLTGVSRDIASGKGHQAPSPGPVTPTTGALGAAMAGFGPAAQPISITSDGDGFTYNIKDAAGNSIGSMKGGVFVFDIYDNRSGHYEKIGTYSSFDNAWQAARNYFAADHRG